VSEAILDSSAALAVIQGEPGAAVVLAALRVGAAMGTVNLAEVVTKLSEGGSSEEDIREAIERLALELVPLDAESAFQAGFLRAATRHAGLSLGDRACLALARQLSLPVLTADRSWQNVDIDVGVRLIR
jgi:ribonuclease VapC